MATRHELYNSFMRMKQRCNNPKSKDYPKYGGRGIKVCERWNGESGFQHFLSDMGPRPDGQSLDRINNDGNYEPSNCRWATRTQQNNNTRRNRFFTINGECKTLSEWIKTSTVKSSTVRQRFYSYGWTIEQSLSAITEAGN